MTTDASTVPAGAPPWASEPPPPPPYHGGAAAPDVAASVMPGVEPDAAAALGADAPAAEDDVPGASGAGAGAGANAGEAAAPTAAATSLPQQAPSPPPTARVEASTKQAKGRFSSRTLPKEATLRAFLRDTFGLELLRSGAGVADIAGGNGRLSFELRNADNVPVTIIDPRHPAPARMRKFAINRALAVARHRRRGRPQAPDADTKAQEAIAAAELVVMPRHCAAFFGPDMWTRGDAGVAPSGWNAAHAPGSREKAGAPCWRCGPTGANGVAREPLAPAEHVDGVSGWMQHKSFQCPNLTATTAAAMRHSSAPADGGAAETTRPDAALAGALGASTGTVDGGVASDAGPLAAAAASRAAGRAEPPDTRVGRGPLADHVWPESEDVPASDAPALLRDCSVIVALHPDQATDDVVRCALELRKPCVVVPCCVFPKTFTHRRLRVAVDTSDGAADSGGGGEGGGGGATGAPAGADAASAAATKDGAVAGAAVSAAPTAATAAASRATTTRPVKTSEQLVRYLVQMGEDAGADPPFQVRCIGFGGRDTCVYWLPDGGGGGEGDRAHDGGGGGGPGAGGSSSVEAAAV